MQPLRVGERRIRQPLRAERPLAYEELSDPILVTRARDGDRRALEALCARHEPKVQKLARRILRDPEDARDAAQDALAKLCVRIRQFRGDSQFATWLHRLVVNTCLDAAAKRRPTDELPDDTRAAEAPDLTLRDELRACLLELPAAQARVVFMKDALGYSFDEIADAESMPVGTAKCYAHRGRNAVRRRLEARVA